MKKCAKMCLLLENKNIKDENDMKLPLYPVDDSRRSLI